MPCVQRRAPRPRPSPFSYVFVERGAGALSQTPPGWLCSGQMAPPIRLSVPGTLLYRPIAVRTVAEAARLVSCSPTNDIKDPTIDPLVHDVRHPFDTAVVSAFMEIFNNIAIHAYQRRGGGTIELTITPTSDSLLIEVKDSGRPFDLGNVVPLPADLDEESLPEGGMGIHIAKTMLDDMTYTPGPPNRWRLYKRLPAAQVAVGRS
ncbi:MAG: ATP-binding protein [Deltaproteobacteria bacterium]|nr:MAG: ATP-binding protein [Deltaproteobacteria bacterium]